MTSSVESLITPEQIENFRRDGVVCLRNVLDASWLTRLEDAIENAIAKPAADAYDYPEGFIGGGGLWKIYDDCDSYCRHSMLPELAAKLFGSEQVRLYFDQLFVKEPGSNAPTPWHNDQPYWAVSGNQVMSFWMSLDHVTQESGAVQYIAGSHLWNRWFQPTGFADEANKVQSYEQSIEYEPVPDFDAERDNLNVVSFDVEPGDLIAFHAMTVHGAGGNTTAHLRRRGYTVRYIGDDVRYDPRVGTNKNTHLPDMKPGSVMEHDRYPIVWPRND